MIKNRSLNDINSLIKHDLIKNVEREAYSKLLKKYPFSITQDLLELMDKNDLNDPIRKQFIPSLEELNATQEEIDDPIGDKVHSKVKGVVHRYPDRVLLKPINTCSIMCRFCFRKDSVKIQKEILKRSELNIAVDYIRKNPEIWEVILTGGEPLLLPIDKLKYILSILSDINHIGLIRIHTRYPIVSPKLITDSFAKIFNIKKPVFIVLHCNHPKEITENVSKAIQILAKNEIPLFSQSVLLKGINDDEKILEKLFKKLTSLKVKPYYLHHLDQVKGTNHFRVSVEKGQDLAKKLRERVSGICQPYYILDIPRGFGKVPINKQYIHLDGNCNNSYSIEDYKGNLHGYVDL